MTTPCYGKHQLFDSRDYRDHVEAKALCDTCPVLLSCYQTLQAVINAPAHLGGSPEGTWAGQLISEREADARKRWAKGDRKAS